MKVTKLLLLVVIIWLAYALVRPSPTKIATPEPRTEVEVVAKPAVARQHEPLAGSRQKSPALTPAQQKLVALGFSPTATYSINVSKGGE